MLSVQLYNSRTNSTGYLDKLGNLISNNSLSDYWVTTDFMQVTPGSKCTYSGITFTLDNTYACYYDINQDFVSSFIPNTETTELVIPNNVYYVRFSLCAQSNINLCSSTFEEGSISNISGAPETDPNYIRTTNFIEANNLLTKLLAPSTTYTLSVSPDVKQIGLYFYRSTIDGGTVYDSYHETTFDQVVNSLTFTTIEEDTFSGLKIKFYNPDGVPIEDFKVMLNLGSHALPYVPYSSTNDNNTSTFSFTIIAEAYQGFRKELYNYLKGTLSSNLTTGDLDIIVRLMCYIFGDLSGMVYHLKDQIDPDKAEEAYLRHLGSVIGYKYNEALTAEEQRESIKSYLDIQRKRGTNYSLKNLIAVTGQTRESYYSTSDLRGVSITEGGNDGTGKDYKIGEVDLNGLYPGDIIIEAPVLSEVLLEAIDNIRLIGTRVLFASAIYTYFQMATSIDDFKEIHQFFDPVYHYGNDHNPTIAKWIQDIEQAYEDEVIDGTNLSDISDWLILQGRVNNCHTNLSCSIYTYQSTPIPEGFVWDEVNLGKHRTFLLDDKTLIDDNVMYGYDGQPRKTEQG